VGLRGVLAVLTPCVAVACTTVDGRPDPAPVDQTALVADNGLFLDNGLKLTNGADAGNGIKLTNGFDLSNGIDLPNGIKLTNGVNTIEPPAGSDLETWIDVDPTMRLRILRYEIECALPAATLVEVVYRDIGYTFAGQIGLGPSWLAGQMSGREQERVSACLLARVNGRGEHLSILLLGPYPGLDSLSIAENVSYPTREATYFGNLFLDTPAAAVDGLSDCGSRACKLDVDRHTCDCGLLLADPPGGCEWWLNPEDVGSNLYDTACSTYLSGTYTFYYNPITTRVRQREPGASCTVDQDCIYYNCVSGVCGGVGATCLGLGNCSWGLECGVDGMCGGTGAVCDASSECVHGNCYSYYCGRQGASCTADDECWGNTCSGGGKCGSCASDSDCPTGTTCFARDQVCTW
jgi:hypothetical protein